MAVEQRRSQVLDLSRPGTVGVEIDVAEAAEVLMSIALLRTPVSEVVSARMPRGTPARRR